MQCMPRCTQHKARRIAPITVSLGGSAIQPLSGQCTADGAQATVAAQMLTILLPGSVGPPRVPRTSFQMTLEFSRTGGLRSLGTWVGTAAAWPCTTKADIRGRLEALQHSCGSSVAPHSNPSIPRAPQWACSTAAAQAGSSNLDIAAATHTVGRGPPSPQHKLAWSDDPCLGGLGRTCPAQQTGILPLRQKGP